MVVIERAAKALIRRRSDGKYLMLTCSNWPENLRRSQKPDLPGGVIEAHEHIEEGLLREIREEVGITPIPGTVQLGRCFTYLYDGVSSNFLVYVAEVEGDEEIVLSWEHESYTWLTAQEILSLDLRRPYPELFHYLSDIGLMR
ncbi:MAG TPA: NUDIX domain-containing protein [Candidatus Saccharibacteria bacterium]|nr:NUDIX domain-containing protein [Candidatus Saccharibacteria bacterium]